MHDVGVIICVDHHHSASFSQDLDSLWRRVLVGTSHNDDLSLVDPVVAHLVVEDYITETATSKVRPGKMLPVVGEHVPLIESDIGHCE